MKKKITIILSVILVISVLCGCSAGMSKDSTNWSNEEASYDYTAPAETPEAKAYDQTFSENGDALTSGTINQHSLSEKIIYSAYADIETTAFDDSVDGLNKLTDKYGGFIEKSNVTGSTYDEMYYGSKSMRYAEFVIRVPSENYGGLTGSLEELGIVTNMNTGVENITEQFYDTQSRVDTYKIEEERLLAMLEKCETVSDMIEIESRISTVRYEIESLQSTLKNWQNEVDYSTVTVCLREVQELREIVENDRSYWQEIGDGFKASAKSVGRFFKGLFKWLISALPVLVTLAAAATAAIVIVKRILRKKAQKADAGKREDMQKAPNNIENGESDD